MYGNHGKHPSSHDNARKRAGTYGIEPHGTAHNRVETCTNAQKRAETSRNARKPRKNNNNKTHTQRNTHTHTHVEANTRTLTYLLIVQAGGCKVGAGLAILRKHDGCVAAFCRLCFRYDFSRSPFWFVFSGEKKNSHFEGFLYFETTPY